MAYRFSKKDSGEDSAQLDDAGFQPRLLLLKK
jgi:hypothetical protein